MNRLRFPACGMLLAILAACAVSPGQPLPDVPPDVALVVQVTPLPTPPLPESGHAPRDDSPLRLMFPTPGPATPPDWRPPQYPVPLSYRPDDHYWFVRPLAADTVNWPLPVYRYGGTFFGEMTVHTGVDIGAPSGTPVLAAGPGKVVWVGWGLYGTRPVEDDPYGLAIALLHDFGYEGQRLYTVYAHLSAATVWVDQPVAAGEVIGAVGETGNTSGPHLHFEVRQGRNSYYTTRNPELWIAPPQGWGVLAGRVEDRWGGLLTEEEIAIRSLATGQRWRVWTYGEKIVVPDDHYGENFAISDLPAGEYQIRLSYRGKEYSAVVPVRAGQTNFVVFERGSGWVVEGQE